MKSLSSAGRKFLIELEGERLVSYPDSGGVWTIGVGHTKGIHAGQIETKQQSDLDFAEDIKPREVEVNRALKTEINQNQFDSLFCFYYNEGVLPRLVLDLIASGNFEQATLHMLAYNKVRNRKTGILEFNQGLYNRRLKEQKLFLTPVQ